MKKHMTIHMNNAKPGAPDLFVAVAELDAENPDQANEKTIAAGKSSFAVIPEDNAIGFLVPVKPNEDPWVKMAGVFEKTVAAFLETQDSKQIQEVIDNDPDFGKTGWFYGLLSRFTKGKQTENDDFFSCENRAIFSANILSQIQLDIVNNNYSAPGRPNCETVIGLLTWSAEDLEPYKTELLEWVNNSSVRDLPIWNGQTEE